MLGSGVAYNIRNQILVTLVGSHFVDLRRRDADYIFVHLDVATLTPNHVIRLGPYHFGMYPHSDSLLSFLVLKSGTEIQIGASI